MTAQPVHVLQPTLHAHCGHSTDASADLHIPLPQITINVWFVDTFGRFQYRLRTNLRLTNTIRLLANREENFADFIACSVCLLTHYDFTSRHLQAQAHGHFYDGHIENSSSYFIMWPMTSDSYIRCTVVAVDNKSFFRHR